MKPYAVLLIGVLAVSSASLLIRLAQAPPLVIATYRLAIASIVFLPIALAKSKGGFARITKTDLLLIILASLFLAAHFGLWITSLSYTSIASSVVLVTANPIFVAFLSYLLWKESLNKLQVVGVLLTLGGAVLINYGGFTLSGRALGGDVMALLAGLLMGGYLIVGRSLRKKLPIVNYLALNYTLAAGFLLLAALAAGLPLLGYTGKTWVMIILLGLVPQLIGHSSFNLALRLVPALFVAVAVLGEPVVATLLGYVVLNEAPTAKEIIGGVLIIAGIFLVIRRGQQA